MQLPPVDRNLSWRPTGADLYSTGASGAVPVRPINPVNPVESNDQIGGGASPAAARSPDKPSAPEAPNRDWTYVRKKETVEEPPEPPKEPISKQLLEFLREMWRVSGTAIIEASEEAAKAAKTDVQLRNNAAEQPLTYSDPKVKRSSKL